MNKILCLLIIFSSIILSGCSIRFSTGDGAGSGNLGGVFATENKGESWQQKALVPTVSGKPKRIDSIDVNALAMDPSDSNALYLGSIGNGFFYSFDVNQGWTLVKDLGQETINAIAVDPTSRCIIYSSLNNFVYKSTDCNRSWSQIYHDDDRTTRIESIAVDFTNSENVFIGTSRGEVIKSTNRGVNWKTVARLESSVKKIIVSPNDSRIMIAATAKKGVYRSINNGATWQSFEDELKKFKDGLTYRDISFGKSTPGLIVLANVYGLLRSFNYGETWEKIDLLTPEKEASINSVAINPKDSKEIYYVTNTSFYHSTDGGKTWAAKKLPSSRAGWRLLINPDNTDILYLGVKNIGK